MTEVGRDGSGEIIKVPQKTGRPGRPKAVELRGAKGPSDRGGHAPKVIGGASATGDVKVFDQRTGPEHEVRVDVAVHGDRMSMERETRGA